MTRLLPHPKLGKFHKFDVSKSNIATALVPDALLAELINHLNRPIGREKSRVIRILEEMLELERIEPPVWNENVNRPLVEMADGRKSLNPELKTIAPAKYQLQLEIHNREDSINRQLSRYRFLPHVSPHGSARRWRVTWEINSSRAAKDNKTDPNQRTLPEGIALQLILDFARAGYLNRLRRCSHCQKWLYAKFRHQAFCSTKCQQTYYTNSDEWRRKRREYMQGYRQRTM